MTDQLFITENQWEKVDFCFFPTDFYFRAFFNQVLFFLLIDMILLWLEEKMTGGNA